MKHKNELIKLPFTKIKVCYRHGGKTVQELPSQSFQAHRSNLSSHPGMAGVEKLKNLISANQERSFFKQPHTHQANIMGGGIKFPYHSEIENITYKKLWKISSDILICRSFINAVNRFLKQLSNLSPLIILEDSW